MNRCHTALVVSLCCALSVAQAPVNNECAGALPVTIGANPGSCAFFSNVGATTSTGYAATCSTMNSDVWFSFTPGNTCVYRISTDPATGCAAGTLTDTVVAVYASCGALNHIACDDDSGTGLLSQVDVTLSGGSTYYIRVGDFSTSVFQGTFNLNVNALSEPVLSFSSPGGAGCVQADITCGPANGSFVFAVTLNQGNFPNGWFYGLAIGYEELVNEFNVGYPFTGPLNANGNASIGPFCGLPTNTVLYAVALGFNGSGYGVPTGISDPVSYTIP